MAKWTAEIATHGENRRRNVAGIVNESQFLKPAKNHI